MMNTIVTVTIPVNIIDIVGVVAMTISIFAFGVGFGQWIDRRKDRK